MRKISILALVLVMALALVPVAFADSFNYTYTGTQGETATGTLSGFLVSPGVYDITSGTITLSGSAMDGTGVFFPLPVPNNTYYVFETGGGTNAFGTMNNFLYPSSNPVLDTNGALLFSIETGAGAGDGVAIWSNGTGNYGIFGGNWALNDQYNGAFSVSAVPIPPSMLMLAPGLLGLVGMRKRFKMWAA